MQDRVHFQEDLPKWRTDIGEFSADSASLLSSTSSGSAEQITSTDSPYKVKKSHIGITSRARITCKACRKRCVGQVVQTAPTEESSSGFESCPDSGLEHSSSQHNTSRLQSNFYHVKCFRCSVCSVTLVGSAGGCSSGGEIENGYFVKNDRLFCPKHYQVLYGEKCTACNSYLTGDIMAVLGRKYHSSCLSCSACRSVIKANERVSTLGGGGALAHDILCSQCSKMVCNQDFDLSVSVLCAGCHSADMRSGDTILAMGYSFHAWCFKCAQCNSLLDGLYFHWDSTTGENLSPQKKQADVESQAPGEKSSNKPLALCPSCFYVNNCAHCYHCQSPIDPGGKRLEIGNRSAHDELFTFHPNCAKCHNCFLCFSDGEEIVVRDSGTITHIETGHDSLHHKVFMHRDCNQSTSRKFIESVDVSLRLDQRDSYSSFRRLLKNVPDQLKSPSNRRSWAFPINPGSSIENYLPKTASQYRLSYLEPRNLATCGGSYLNSMYCRFIVPSSGLVSKQEKLLHYLSLRFHEEKLVEIEPSVKKDSDVPLYPKEVLSTLNKVMPKGVNRSKLESHLSDGDFFSVFKMSREEFYRLPIWKQNFLKKMHNLF